MPEAPPNMARTPPNAAQQGANTAQHRPTRPGHAQGMEIRIGFWTTVLPRPRPNMA